MLGSIERWRLFIGAHGLAEGIFDGVWGETFSDGCICGTLKGYQDQVPLWICKLLLWVLRASKADTKKQKIASNHILRFTHLRATSFTGRPIFFHLGSIMLRPQLGRVIYMSCMLQDIILLSFYSS